MAGNKEFPLSLVIRAVDKATAPLRNVNKQIAQLTKPVRLLNNSLVAFSKEAGIPRLMKGFQGVGSATIGVGREVASLGFKVSAMAAGASFALYQVVHGAVEAGDKLGEMAQRVGLSVDAYAQLQFAAAQSDVEQEQFNGAMDAFNRRLGDAKAGGGELLSFLQKVAPALALQVKGAKSTEEAFGLMTEAFTKVTDPGKRAALAAAAFGKGSLQMGQFLGQGSAKLDELRQRFMEIAGSQAAFASGAGDLDNAIRETELSFMGLRNAAAGALFPALTEVAKAVTGVVGANRESLRAWATEAAKAIQSWVAGGGIGRLVEGIKDFASSVKKISDSLGGFKGLLVGVGLVMGGPLIGSVWRFVGALWKLGGAVIPVVTRAALLLWPVLENLGIWAYLYGWPAMVKLGTAIWGVAGSLGAAAAAAAPFVAAAAGLAAAGFAIYKEWNNIKFLFTDFTKPGGLLTTLQEMFKNLRDLMPDKWLGTAATWWQENLFGGGATPQARPMLGAAQAAAPVGAASSETKVTVDFNNAPPGTRVTHETSGPAEFDWSMGQLMGVP